MLNSNIKLTINAKRNSIRINKKTIQCLKNPQYIQILVDPIKNSIAIVGYDNPLKDKTSIKPTVYSNEIYSKGLVDEIINILQESDKNSSYKLTGEIDEQNRIAHFSLNNIIKNESSDFNE